jgi:glycosyltransferase involved in cell wall biosynthesis
MSEPLPSPPTLLIVTTIARTIERFLLPYAEHQRSLGWRVHGAAAGVAASQGVVQAFDAVHDIPLSRSIVNVGALIRGYRAISRVLDDVRPDIVHVHTPIASFLTRLAVRRRPTTTRPVVIYTAHGFHFFRGGPPIGNALYLIAEWIAGRWTDRLVVINEEDERAVRRYRIVPLARSIRMPGIGLDTAAFSAELARSAEGPPWKSRLGIPEDASMFVIVGELTRNKRQADAIAALALMHDTSARLVVVGDGPARTALAEQAAVQGVASRVQLVGSTDDVPAVLVDATALVTTSQREGLSRSIMEAYALGVPVVASTARGNRELVGGDGWIVDTGDIVGLADRLDWMATHEAERHEMGRRGRARMVATYDIRPLVQRHARLYDELLRDVARSAHAADPADRG